MAGDSKTPFTSYFHSLFSVCNKLSHFWLIIFKKKKKKEQKKKKNKTKKQTSFLKKKNNNKKQKNIKNEPPPPKKKKTLYSHICILLSEDRIVLKNNTFRSWKNDGSDAYSYLLKVTKSVYKTFSNR